VRVQECGGNSIADKHDGRDNRNEDTKLPKANTGERQHRQKMIRSNIAVANAALLCARLGGNPEFSGVWN
jgi:hypothetical protein